MSNIEYRPKRLPKSEEEEEKFQREREIIEKLIEATEKYGPSISKISQSEYFKYYKIFERDKMGYENLEDFWTRKTLPKMIKKVISEKYKFEIVIASLDMEKVVEHFLQEKYPKRKTKVEVNVVIELLNDWKEEIKGKLKKKGDKWL